MPPRSRRSSRRCRPRYSRPVGGEGHLEPQSTQNTQMKPERLWRASASRSATGRLTRADCRGAVLFACIRVFCGSISMTDDLQALQSETEAALAAATDLRAWDTVRVATLGRNGQPHRTAARPRQDPARAAPGAGRRAEPAQGRADRRHRGPPRHPGERRAGRPAGGRAPRSDLATTPAGDRADPPDQPYHGGDRRHLRRHGLRDRRRARTSNPTG